MGSHSNCCLLDSWRTGISLYFLDAATVGFGTAFAVGAILGTTNAVGAASNFANGFLSSKPEDTHLSFTGNYDQGVTEHTSYMQNSTTSLWAPSDPSQFGTDVVTNTMKGGLWIGVSVPFNVPHLGGLRKTFFDTLLVTSLINTTWKNNVFYNVFVPYGTTTDFMQKASSTPGTMQFTKTSATGNGSAIPSAPTTYPAI